jgi:hypothetical protein
MSIRFRWILGVLLVPFVLLGLAVLATRLYGLMRYEPAYFTETYLERYETPGSVVRALESALQTDDQLLLAELQGLRWPAQFRTSPSMVFAMLLERTDRYTAYLYFDMQTYERYPHYLEQVEGRWVVSPPDLYYYMNSGQWQSVFLPLSITWWISGLAFVIVVWVSRVFGRSRARLYGE